MGSGGKIPPKYRDPDNPANTWAGRGAIPKWMAGKLRKGVTRQDFLIETSSASTRKKRSAKKKSRRAKTKTSARGGRAKTRSKSALRAARPRSAPALMPNSAAGAGNGGSPPE
jgi:hypothetical protein